MRKGWRVVLVLIIAGYLAFSFANAKKQEKFSGYDQNIFHYAMTNYDIQDGVLRNFYLGTEADKVKGEAGISDIVSNIESITAKMKEMTVPKVYKQAHGELLTAYQDFAKLLAPHQQAVKNRNITDSDLEMLTAGYVNISQASDKWYAIYKKRDHSMSPPASQKLFEVIGKDQDLLYYMMAARSPIDDVVRELEGNLLPAVERQDFGAADKYMSNVKFSLVQGISYYKHVRVPEPFSDVHQELLNSLEELYDFMADTESAQINEGFLKKVTEYDQQFKQALDQWEQVQQQVHLF